MSVWFGLVAVRPKQEEVLAQEKAAGLDSACVLERVGKGNDVVERTLGAEVQLFREEDQEWMRYGVITKQAEWVADACGRYGEAQRPVAASGGVGYAAHLRCYGAPFSGSIQLCGCSTAVTWTREQSSRSYEHSIIALCRLV
jgi:hypothetical protein